MARKSKGEVRKREILEHFYDVLVAEGLEGASIAKIAKKLKVHPSLILHYFSTKEEMVLALVDFIIEKYESTFLPNLEEVKDPLKRFHLFFNILFGLEYDKLVDDSVFAACYYLSLRNPSIRKAFQSMFIRLRRVVLQEIQLYQEAGIIQADDPEKMADLIIAIEEGLSFMRSFMGPEEGVEQTGEYLKNIAFSLLRPVRESFQPAAPGNRDKDSTG